MRAEGADLRLFREGGEWEEAENSTALALRGGGLPLDEWRLRRPKRDDFSSVDVVMLSFELFE